MIKQKNLASRSITTAVIFVSGTGLGYLIAYLSGIQPSYIPLVSAILGLIVAFFIPVWQAFFINKPSLSVEINAIKRTVSDAALISIDDEPELRSLKPPQSLGRVVQFVMSSDSERPEREPSSNLNRQNKRAYTLTQTEELLSDAKQRLRDLPVQIEERKKERDRVNSLTSLTKYECDKLNGPLAPEVEYDHNSPEKTIESLREAYQRRLEAVEKRYAELQGNLPAIERKIEFLRKDLVDNRSYFTVSASLINSGKSNTAIKVPALLRVSIGEGNYIDLKLILKDFENKSEISANGTRIILFESSEVSTLPEEDRKLINTYWGQSVSSRLYIEDIHSKTHSSNTIAFAEGLYQKIIYDRLAQAASASANIKN